MINLTRRAALLAGLAASSTRADSVAKFTCAVTPGKRFNTVSIRVAQAAQVMPDTSSSMVLRLAISM